MHFLLFGSNVLHYCHSSTVYTRLFGFFVTRFRLLNALDDVLGAVVDGALRVLVLKVKKQDWL